MTDDEIRASRANVPKAGPDLHGDSVVLRPVAPADVPELGRIARTTEVESRWGDEYLNEDWPLDDPSATVLVVLVEGRVAGMIQYSEENDPKYQHAGIDIFLDPAMHGRGHGRDAVRTLARHLVGNLGHHRLVIDPAADNEPAIRSYSAVGFRPVGVMRRYERDADGSGWHDGLLMDLLAEELR
ncbi:MAG: GNAT family N-acetyltransferase [Actinomycetota bacterium]|nr:GNAT family N-acetyltransferase [Rubrobacteraceae bacterium]MDQ3252106.1 GNAT family N-acetyltransferase [Actinomycetota bacterium]